jgi:arylsulfatase A-like enzyme
VRATLIVMDRVRQSVSDTVLAVYLFCFAEWLFQITKPSFMSVLSVVESLRVLLVSPLYLLIPLILVQIGVALLVRLAPRSWRTPHAWPLAVVPAAVHAATAMLLIDNFVYTLFGVGIVSLSGRIRYLFAAAWLALFVAIVRMQSRRIRPGNLLPGRARLRYRAALALVGMALLAAVGQVATASRVTAVAVAVAPPHRRLPDIVFISMDGTEAAHTSVYGYERPTTPVLDRLASSSLVAENAFSNNCYTSGSLLSLLAGQRPTDFRVFYPPMMLRGADAYQHLPGILRKLGYRSNQVTDRYWASSLWQGMRDGFDYVNGVDTRSQELRVLPAALADRLPSERQFLIQTRTRILERARHLLGIEDMPPPMDVVRNLAGKGSISDPQRVANAMEFLKQQSARPAFLQVHLMKGHCCFYVIPPDRQHFSLENDGRAATVIDRYDDAISMMDASIGEIVSWLEQEAKLDGTLLVVTSDHTMNWQTSGRVPLLIRFPHAEPRGRITANAQLADIAPTVLDYLGIPKPPWMTGESLLRAATFDRRRPIISASRVEKAPFRMPKPPLFGLLSVGAVVCDRWHELLLATGELATGQIAGHTAPCEAHDYPDPAAIRTMLQEHLTTRGFGLPAWPATPAKPGTAPQARRLSNPWG